MVLRFALLATAGFIGIVYYWNYDQRGIQFPGYRYCGPMNHGFHHDPANGLDTVCQSHDYCEWQSWRETGQSANCDCDDEFLNQLISFRDQQPYGSQYGLSIIFSTTIWIRKAVALSCKQRDVANLNLFVAPAYSSDEMWEPEMSNLKPTTESATREDKKGAASSTTQNKDSAIPQAISPDAKPAKALDTDTTFLAPKTEPEAEVSTPTSPSPPRKIQKLKPKSSAAKRQDARKRFREKIGTTHDHRFINRYKKLNEYPDETNEQ